LKGLLSIDKVAVRSISISKISALGTPLFCWPADITVKAPHFEPHGNFGTFFQKGLLSLKRVLQKNEENKSCRKKLDLQVWFCSFFVHDSSTEDTELAIKSPKFP
jgi:hypothetical protein